MDVSIKDNDNNVHNINVDTLSDNSETQVVKLQLGDASVDGGYASKFNPVPVEMVGFFKRLFVVFGRLSFDTSSALRTSGAVTVSSGTVTTVSTVSSMTTGNIGIGDWGKAATAQQQSQQAFMMGIRQNFVRV